MVSQPLLSSMAMEPRNSFYSQLDETKMAVKKTQEPDPAQCPFVSEGDPFRVRALRQTIHTKLGGRQVFHCAQDEPSAVRNSLVALNWGETGNCVILIRPSADQAQVVMDTYKAGRITASAVIVEYSGRYLDRRMVLFKEANKCGRFIEHTYMRAGADSNELKEHIVKWSKARGIIFSPEAFRYLHENFPTMIADVRSSSGNKSQTEVYDLQTADSEIGKLASVLDGSNTVTLNLLQDYCSFESGKGVYTLIKYIQSGNMPKAYEIVERDFLGAKESVLSDALRAMRYSMYLAYHCKLLEERYGTTTSAISQALASVEFRGKFVDWSKDSTTDDEVERKSSKLELPDWRVKFILRDCAGNTSERLYKALIATECAIIDSVSGLNVELVFQRALAACFNNDI
jgi:hypothetical protein